MKARFTPNVALLRPPNTNRANRTIQSMLKGQEDVKLFEPLASDQDQWSTESEMRKIERIREQIEDTVEKLDRQIRLYEIQLRRRKTRHLQSNDMEHTHNELRDAHVIAVSDPTYNQVKHLRNHLRYNPIVRLIIFYSEHDRLDDYIDDFMDQSRLALFEGPGKPIDTKRATRIFPAKVAWDDEVERAVTNATDFEGLGLQN